MAMARHAAVRERYALNIYDEYLGFSSAEEYDEFVAFEFDHMAMLRRLFQEYQQAVGRIPIGIADNIIHVHDCGMVFQVLHDHQQWTITIDLSAGRRPFFPCLA